MTPRTMPLSPLVVSLAPQSASYANMLTEDDHTVTRDFDVTELTFQTHRLTKSVIILDKG